MNLCIISRLFALLVLLATTCDACDLCIIDSIALAENSHGRVGRHGEVSVYQIKPEVWRQHAKRPWDGDPAFARSIALAHVKWLRRQIHRQGYASGVYTLAVAWNAGLGAIENPAKIVRDYARRVTNLHEIVYRRRHHSS